MNQGTEKETTARRIVAVNVMRKPGVAGLIEKNKNSVLKVFGKE